MACYLSQIGTGGRGGEREREKEEGSIKGVFETLCSSSSPPTAIPCLSEHPEPEGRAGRKDIEMEGSVRGVEVRG